MNTKLDPVKFSDAIASRDCKNRSIFVCLRRGNYELLKDVVSGGMDHAIVQPPLQDLFTRLSIYLLLLVKCNSAV